MLSEANGFTHIMYNNFSFEEKIRHWTDWTDTLQETLEYLNVIKTSSTAASSPQVDKEFNRLYDV